MPGVRLYTPNRRAWGRTALVTTPARYPVPYACGRCGRVHEQKTIHLDVDETGHVIVSPEVWETLRGLGSPFAFANEVANPPAQVVSLAGQPPARLRPVEEL